MLQAAQPLTWLRVLSRLKPGTSSWCTFLHRLIVGSAVVCAAEFLPLTCKTQYTGFESKADCLLPAEHACTSRARVQRSSVPRFPLNSAQHNPGSLEEACTVDGV